MFEVKNPQSTRSGSGSCNKLLTSCNGSFVSPAPRAKSFPVPAGKWVIGVSRKFDFLIPFNTSLKDQSPPTTIKMSLGVGLVLA